MLLVNLKQEYLHLSVFILLSIILSGFLLVLSYLVSNKKKMISKNLLLMSVGLTFLGLGAARLRRIFLL